MLNIKLRFKFFLNCMNSSNDVIKSIAAICKDNPMSCAGNNYRMLLNTRNELVVEGVTVWGVMFNELSATVYMC